MNVNKTVCLRRINSADAIHNLRRVPNQEVNMERRNNWPDITIITNNGVLS